MRGMGAEVRQGPVGGRERTGWAKRGKIQSLSVGRGMAMVGLERGQRGKGKRGGTGLYSDMAPSGNSENATACCTYYIGWCCTINSCMHKIKHSTRVVHGSNFLGPDPQCSMVWFMSSKFKLPTGNNMKLFISRETEIFLFGSCYVSWGWEKRSSIRFKQTSVTSAANQRARPDPMYPSSLLLQLLIRRKSWSWSGIIWAEQVIRLG